MLAIARWTHAVPVTACGQVITAPDVGMLTGDLDCSGRRLCQDCSDPRRCIDTEVTCAADGDCSPSSFCVGAPAVVLRGARLELGGFSLRGESAGVSCVSGHSSVVGPGRIFGSKVGISQGRGRLQVRDVTLDGNELGLWAARGTVIDVRVTGNADAGLRGETLTLERVTVSGYRVGVSVDKRVTATDLSVVGAEYSLWSDRRASAQRFTTQGALIGVRARQVRLLDSFVVGSSIADVSSDKRPRVENTECETSAGAPPDGGTWRVCNGR